MTLSKVESSTSASGMVGKSTSVIKRAMQSAVGPDRHRDKVLHLLRFANVRLHKDGFASLAFDQVRGPDTRGIDIADYYLRAVACKAKRCSATNPRAPACNKRNLASEIQFIFVECHLSYLVRLSATFRFESVTAVLDQTH